MRNLVVALGLAAISAAALGQEAAAPAAAQASAWQLFENDDGKKGAIATAADGSQLVLKCDKPGRREVHAIILAATGVRVSERYVGPVFVAPSEPTADDLTHPEHGNQGFPWVALIMPGRP